jgi:putative CocE/NonD family hydrolase
MPAGPRAHPTATEPARRRVVAGDGDHGDRRRPGRRWSTSTTGRLGAVAGAVVLVATAATTLAGGPAGATVGGAAGAVRASTLTGSVSWAPQPARYGMLELANQPVRAADDTILRADVYEPAVPGTTTAAPGRFPVLLQQTPYGSQNLAEPGSGSLSNTDIASFVDRGFVVVMANVRGTGTSGGSFGLFDPVQASDGATLVRWAAHLPHADGRVGLFGESYMGIDQFLTVAQLGPGSPVKAMFPIIAGNDLYRDTVTQGGLVDMEFSAFYLALVAGLDTANPVLDPLELLGGGSSAAALAAAGGAGAEELAHDESLLSYDAPTLLDVETGGPEAYDGSYWQVRSPVRTLEQVVTDHVPAFLVGGWHDLFQRGELLNYTGLQNAVDGRPVLAPMRPGQRVTPRYQLLMGPWFHLTAGQGVDLTRLMLEWFDTWLLGENTPLAHTRDPLHLDLLGTDHWIDAQDWPLPQEQATTFYFGPGPAGPSSLAGAQGSLSPRRPTSTTGADTVVWTGISSACDLQTDQWAAGLVTVAAEALHTTDPCDADDSTLVAGPGAATFTSAPFDRAQVLGGPIDVTVRLRATTTDTELVATVEAISPSGRSEPITSGALLGSFRRLDPADSWTGSDGRLLLPYHPYTRASVEPVVPGRIETDDIEVFPTFAEIPAGWRLRVTVTTSDTPHLVPTLSQLPHLVGGIYQIERTASAPSYANLPLAPVTAFPVPCGQTCS